MFPATPDAATVESFSLRLSGWSDLLNKATPAVELENRLLAELGPSARLLRWAVVQIEATADGPVFRCEGAYLQTK